VACDAVVIDFPDPEKMFGPVFTSSNYDHVVFFEIEGIHA